MKYLCLEYRPDDAGEERSIELTTLQFDNGRAHIVDEPIVPVANRIRIVEARDLNHVIQLNSHLPNLRQGGRVDIYPLDA